MSALSTRAADNWWLITKLLFLHHRVFPRSPTENKEWAEDLLLRKKPTHAHTHLYSLISATWLWRRFFLLLSNTARIIVRWIKHLNEKHVRRLKWIPMRSHNVCFWSSCKYDTQASIKSVEKMNEKIKLGQVKDYKSLCWIKKNEINIFEMKEISKVKGQAQVSHKSF